jgi:two-component sensor histidine kinase
MTAERNDRVSVAGEKEAELRLLFHRLNNQLGIILSHAELLEAKSTEEMNRSRAIQVINSALEAIGTAREIRVKVDT